MVVLGNEQPDSEFSQALRPFQPIVRYLDMTQFNSLTPAFLFQTIYELLTAECDEPSWQSMNSEQAYREFLEQARTADRRLADRYGERHKRQLKGWAHILLTPAAWHVAIN